MIKAFAAVAAVLLLTPSVASAQNRAGDAALGAVSGAIVLGPIGAVAGAFIGYSAGPSIERSWGLDRPRSSRPRRQASRDFRGARAEQTGAGGSRPAAQPERNAHVATSRNDGGNIPPAAAPAAASAKLPPVQTLE